MRHLTAGLMLVLASVNARATQVVDDFETGNPHQWAWEGSRGGPGDINPQGGDPASWFDSNDDFYGWHPMITSIPPDGTKLRLALASGRLNSVSLEFQRLSTDCFPDYDLPSAMTLQLVDLHSDPGGSVIIANTTNGPDVPAEGSPWQTVRFAIPSGSQAAIPDGWEILAPPELHYTWQDLMANIDAIAFYPLNPDDITYESCWHTGVDDIVVTYGDDVFSSGFDQ
jgi:hypothetical protein